MGFYCKQIQALEVCKLYGEKMNAIDLAKEEIDCEHKGHVFDFNCKICRDRFIITEPCKSYRKSLADHLSKRWSEFDYKKEPSCGCLRKCKRIETKNMYSGQK